MTTTTTRSTIYAWPLTRSVAESSRAIALLPRDSLPQLSVATPWLITRFLATIVSDNADPFPSAGVFRVSSFGSTSNAHRWVNLPLSLISLKFGVCCIYCLINSGIWALSNIALSINNCLLPRQQWYYWNWCIIHCFNISRISFNDIAVEYWDWPGQQGFISSKLTSCNFNINFNNIEPGRFSPVMAQSATSIDDQYFLSPQAQ